jgi:hypothetical protein
MKAVEILRLFRILIVSLLKEPFGYEIEIGLHSVIFFR